MHQNRISDVLHYAERYHGQNLAYAEPPVTYADFTDGVRRLAGYLRAQGVGVGDRVAALLPNSKLMLDLQLSVPSMGSVFIPLNSRLAVAELRFILADAAPQVLIVGEAFSELSAEFADLVPKIIHASQLDDLQSVEPIELGVGFGEDDLALIFYTGGTTGDPKGVMLTHKNAFAVSLRTSWLMKFKADDVILYATPMYHMAAWVYSLPIVWGGGAHYAIPKFDAEQVLRAMDRHRVTFQCYLPAVLQMLIEHPDFDSYDTSSMRYIVQGGATPALLKRAISAFPNVSFRPAYGATETTGHLTMLLDQQLYIDDPRGRSVGRPAPGIQVLVRRPDGTPCAPGEVGEIVGAGDNIMKGYLNRPELTEEVLKNGEYWTGDLGFADADGYLYIVDRVKDMVKSGGENVFSAEVERALASHPAVREVIVIGVPDAKWGERVHAAIVLNDGMSASESELIAHCRPQIAGYKIPRTYEFLAELPKNEAGKILKRVVRDRHWDSEEGRALRGDGIVSL